MHIVPRDVFEHVLYLALHRAGVGLYLPTAEIGAIIFYFNKYVFAHLSIII
jgi:hypothetical protein